ncbi:MAG TPA: hypothetical protein VF771_08155, partial [Longimicrobiaceae bacterium]
MAVTLPAFIQGESMAMPGRSTAHTRFVSPAERDPYLAICARLGVRLGRIATWPVGSETEET